MSLSQIIKDIGRGQGGSRDLDALAARQLFGAMLDGGVPELELGAILIAFRMKGESLSELLGFHQALEERVHRLAPPAGEARTVVIPSYGGARSQPNLMPLLALMLKRTGVPALVHGTLEGHGRVASALIFRELGIMPASSLAQAQAGFEREGLAYVPLAALAPGLAQILSLRSRLGVRNSAHMLAKLIDPFSGAGLRVIPATDPYYLDKVREFLIASGETALLMRGTEGEAYANPGKRPRIELCRDGELQVLFEEEHVADEERTNAPATVEAKATAAYIRRVLEGEEPVPRPIANQLACCLFASGYADDFNRAKAMAAVFNVQPIAARADSAR
jgi:anthranilate phosphoribosyltransferase